MATLKLPKGSPTPSNPKPRDASYTHIAYALGYKVPYAELQAMLVRSRRPPAKPITQHKQLAGA